MAMEIEVIRSWGSNKFSTDVLPHQWDVAYANNPAAAVEELVSQIKNRGNIPLVMFDGGADVSPHLYGEENDYSHTHPHRDMIELAVFEAAKELQVPMFGFCRGHQLLAVANGGSLHQDIHADFNYACARTHANSNMSAHEVVPTSHVPLPVLRSWENSPFGANRISSTHHQCVKRLPLNSILLYSADDGIVEALLYPFGMTVQGHPEFMDWTALVEWTAKAFY